MFVYWSENLHLNFPTDISAGAGRSAAMMNIHLGLCWDGFQEQARCSLAALCSHFTLKTQGFQEQTTGLLAASSGAGRKILSSEQS